MGWASVGQLRGSVIVFLTEVDRAVNLNSPEFLDQKYVSLWGLCDL